MKHRCPICHKIIEEHHQERSGEVRFFPFCSRRCKLIDLGAWLDAEYKVISEPSEAPSDADTDKQ
ncbi:MAG TPA: DNA gyrase inhibitor YacG [Phycisphaerales bacterium]|nr:DNA gyrase inhibitor YacG [Phycisphaerales bacterium]